MMTAFMIPTARRPPRRRRPPPPCPERAIRASEAPLTYGRSFWMAYVSNSLITVAIALLYRYADFVTLLGGTEFHLGWIVGVGMIGSLLMRLALGTYIDRYGTKFIWLGCTLLFVAVCFAHLAVASYSGVAIYLLRILYLLRLGRHFRRLDDLHFHPRTQPNAWANWSACWAPPAFWESSPAACWATICSVR